MFMISLKKFAESILGLTLSGGGVHAIIVPEDAIKSADAVCTGEGEFAFQEFFDKFRNGKDFTDTKNFWFRYNAGIIRNPFRPLMSGDEMTNLPLLEYANGEEIIYEPNRGFRPLTKMDYLQLNSLAYNTIWTIGCPFHCTYCGNTKFIDNDKLYGRLRHPSAEYMVSEIKHALKVHPFIGSVIFNDDSFMVLTMEVLQEFAQKYKKEIDIPFAVYGVIPNYVQEEKFDILVRAGMNRIRMGIQSGSERILKFYKRPSPPKRVMEATETINKFTPYMIPPVYDIITDNPIETKQDVEDTLRLLYKMPRPFTLNIYSLRLMPNTHMEKQFKELDITHQDMASSGYFGLAPTLANALMYLLGTFRPPKFLFEWWIKKAQPYHIKQRMYPRLIFFFRFLWLFKRGLDHLRHMDFVQIPGQPGYVLYKFGIINFWKKYLVRKYEKCSSQQTVH